MGKLPREVGCDEVGSGGRETLGFLELLLGWAVTRFAARAWVGFWSGLSAIVWYLCREAAG